MAITLEKLKTKTRISFLNRFKKKYLFLSSCNQTRGWSFGTRIFKMLLKLSKISCAVLFERYRREIKFLLHFRTIPVHVSVFYFEITDSFTTIMIIFRLTL